MVLTAKQTHGAVEQNRESRSKHVFMWANNFQQKKSQKHTVEKGKPLQ